eukprot:351484-Chlamydomonas_euryale.AAC.3
MHALTYARMQGKRTSMHRCKHARRHAPPFCMHTLVNLTTYVLWSPISLTFTLIFATTVVALDVISGSGTPERHADGGGRVRLSSCSRSHLVWRCEYGWPMNREICMPDICATSWYCSKLAHVELAYTRLPR